MARTGVRSLLEITLVAALACGGQEEEPAAPSYGGWTPGTALASVGEPLRGMLDRRGVIHAHSVYSHDACDDHPRDPVTDVIDEVCFDDFRRGLCQTRHDFVMLTDHGESFSRTEFPDTLLYRPDRGDALIDRGAGPVASWGGCDDGPALILAGNESDMMPVGIEQHVAPTEDERGAIYGTASVTSVNVLRANGAVVLLQHTEDWSPEQIADLGVDGFEMFNLHANTIRGAGPVFGLLAKRDTPEELPHPDLSLLPIVSEDPRYLETWGTVLSRGHKRVTTIGTDAHRNTLREALPDGERIDSYRRMMIWMSNHLLVRPEADGSWDDRHLKDALRSGRAYGVFEVLGYPGGFDYRAEVGGAPHEMGEVTSATDAPELVVTAPRVRDLDPALPAPLITLRLLVAAEGGWSVVAEGDTEELRHTATAPGAYRAEVRIRPHHLEPFLSSYVALADADFVWIYGNPIYVMP